LRKRKRESLEREREKTFVESQISLFLSRFGRDKKRGLERCCDDENVYLSLQKVAEREKQVMQDMKV
jgi:hypothetical protein